MGAVGSMFDLIDMLNPAERADHARGMLLHGLLHAFFVPKAAGWGVFTLEGVLNHWRIPVYGRGFRGASLYFHVPAKQTERARYILKRYRVPVYDSPLEVETLMAEIKQGQEQTKGGADGNKR